MNLLNGKKIKKNALKDLLKTKTKEERKEFYEELKAFEKELLKLKKIIKESIE